MEIKAQQSYLRISPRKLRLIVKELKGFSLDKAISSLPFVIKNGSSEIAKVLKQAKANAVNNLKLDEKKLFIKEIQVGAGPTLKRGRPVARGMWHPIKKRTSHIRVILEV